MNKKLFLLLVSIWFFNLGIVQAQWMLENSPTKNNLNAISLTKNNSFWIVGDKGTILYKKDNSWKDYQSPTVENLYSVFMLNGNNGWAVGAKGTIIHFDGENWQSVPSPIIKNLFSVYFKDAENGIAVGEAGSILTFKNGTWTTVGKGIRGDLFTACFDRDGAWIGGGLECVKVPIMKLVTKGGISLINNFDTDASINSIFFLDSYSGWAVGSPSALLCYDGTGWEKPIIDDKFSSLKSVFFSDKNNGISVGYGGTILIFSGDRWIKEYSSTFRNLRASCISDNTYYSVGDSGTIISKSRPLNNKISSPDEEIPEKLEVFPNPCNEVLNIRLNSGNIQTSVKATITNTAGQIVVQKDLNGWNGKLAYPIVTSGLNSGLYNLQVFTGGKPSTVKFIILH